MEVYSKSPKPWKRSMADCSMLIYCYCRMFLYCKWCIYIYIFTYFCMYVYILLYYIYIYIDDGTCKLFANVRMHSECICLPQLQLGTFRGLLCSFHLLDQRCHLFATRHQKTTRQVSTEKMESKFNLGIDLVVGDNVQHLVWILSRSARMKLDMWLHQSASTELPNFIVFKHIQTVSQWPKNLNPTVKKSKNRCSFRFPFRGSWIRRRSRYRTQSVRFAASGWMNDEM